MHISAFAERYRVKTVRDEDGETVIPGRLWKNQPDPHRTYGHQVFESGGGRLCVLVMFETPIKWTNVKKKLISAGFDIRQDGTTEGVASFEAENETQANLALKLAGIRIRRKLTPERKAALAIRLEAARAKRIA